MKISMYTVENAIKPYIIEKTLRSDAAMMIESALFLDSETELYRADCLYVCLSKHLPIPILIPDKTNIICLGKPSAYAVEAYAHINLILVSDDINLKKFFNTILGTLEKYTMWEEKLDCLLKNHASLQEFLDLGAVIFKEPMCLLDYHHNVLATTSMIDSQDDDFWTYLKKGYINNSPEIISHKQDKFNDIVDARSPVAMISSISGKYKLISAIYVDNKPIAFLAMIHSTKDKNNPFDIYVQQLFNFFVNSITQRLHQSALTSKNKQLADEKQNGAIQSNFNIPGLDLTQILKYFDFKAGKQFQIALFQFNEPQKKPDHVIEISYTIEAAIPYSKCVLSGELFIAVIDLQYHAYLPKAVAKRFIGILEKNDGYCVLSPVFHLSEELPHVLLQVSEVINFCMRLQPDTRLNHYHDYAVLHCLKALSENENMSYILHPMLRKLIDYDIKYGTDYYDTLKVYLKNNCSIAESAIIKHMHRNSFLYRIKRIKELLNNDLDDCDLRFKLLFSIYYLDCENIITNWVD
ncbi:helix-turn-helix domain-containing protein [Dehalobacter sp. DCM]|uniref:PucR family transcriptional regulator n=1 Tax=Dehalobacter sp. DCM TaxID=2907827 RepID=UPI003081370E|nr:helix-turn-helix domain-containing protein [Dehalobacter sp. DCM]